ncbi:MAG: double zinc ribbon domain-containing protein [Armatimonadota bacterium]
MIGGEEIVIGGQNVIGMAGNPFSLVLEGVLSLLFPPRCEICGMLQEPLICASCLAQFQRIEAPYCRLCGIPFDPLAQSPDICADCRESPPPFDAARSAGSYAGALRQAIHQFKYDGVRALAGVLGDYLADVERPFPVDCLCPVPLHPARERMRGYNQSLLLAEELSQHWEAPVQADLLARTRNTPPQMQLADDERKGNVRGAFHAGEGAAGQAVALVDDVFTTGSTLRECSQALKRAGARQVLVVTVGRTLKGDADL